MAFGVLEQSTLNIINPLFLWLTRWLAQTGFEFPTAVFYKYRFLTNQNLLHTLSIRIPCFLWAECFAFPGVQWGI
jgi:hypothetical protein